ncbi:MAG: GNAT family N-acetyltransferase [Thermoflexales bacterium]
MFAGASTFTHNPHIRQLDPWRDGRALAALLESAFAEEALESDNRRLINALRSYALWDALWLAAGTSFVWIEDGVLVGNASIQRNPSQRDTWIVGNVATQAEYRNRGIGRALVEACINYAAARRARYVALQVDATNAPARHLYEKLGFVPLVEVTQYVRASLRGEPLPLMPPASLARHACHTDRQPLWELSRRVLPAALSFAEAVDDSVYRLGIRWSLVNALNGNAEAWMVLPSQEGDALCAAARTRVNYDGAYHYFELLLAPECSAEAGRLLALQALQRLERFLPKPIFAAQPHPNPSAHQILCSCGFRPRRVLVHMRLEL